MEEVIKYSLEMRVLPISYNKEIRLEYKESATLEEILSAVKAAYNYLGKSSN